MNEPQNIKDHHVLKRTQITNEPQICKETFIVNEPQILKQRLNFR